MHLIYLTAKEYPATTADHIYIRFLARAFARMPGIRFLLLVRGTQSSDLREIPVRVVASPRVFRTAFYFFWLPHFMRSLRGEVVFFCNDLNLLSVLAFWRPFFGTRVRIVSDWHLLTGTWKDRFVARRSDILITTSQTLREGVIRDTGVSPERVHVVYGGIDIAPYEEPVRYGRAALGLPDGYLVGYVGLFRTLGKEKGLRTMIDALPLVPADISFAFVGGSAAEIEEYARYAGERGVGDRCIWIERQPFDKVVAYERSMDALAIPYPDEPHFRDYGFPMKAYEYIASGVPVIYSALPILGEVFARLGTSFVPGDAGSFADAVTRVREDGRSCADASLAQRYGWEEKARAILSLVGIRQGQA